MLENLKKFLLGKRCIRNRVGGMQMIDLHTHTNDSDGTWNLFVHPYCIKQFEKVKK